MLSNSEQLTKLSFKVIFCFSFRCHSSAGWIVFQFHFPVKEELICICNVSRLMKPYCIVVKQWLDNIAEMSKRLLNCTAISLQLDVSLWSMFVQSYFFLNFLSSIVAISDSSCHLDFQTYVSSRGYLKRSWNRWLNWNVKCIFQWKLCRYFYRVCG